MKAVNQPKQEFSDKQPKAIVKVVAGCIALLVIFGIGGFAYLRSQSVEMETITIDEEAIARGVSDDVMKYVDTCLSNYTDENGNPLTLTDEEMESLQTACTNEILSMLEGTDLLSLTDAQMQELVTNIKKSVINNALKSSSLSNYFTDEDYENIATYLSENLTGELGNLQKQITANKKESDEKNASQDNEINSLKSSIQDVKTTLTNDATSSSSSLSGVKDDISNINSSINDTNNSIAIAKEQLTSLIEANTALDETTKAELLKLIEESNASSAADLVALCDELTNKLNTLSISSASSIDELNASLNTAISENAALSEEERAKLLAIVEANKTSTDSDIAGLASDLTDAVNSLTSLSAEQKTQLLAQIGALETSTVADLAALDDKYDVYYEIAFSESITWASNSATVTITNSAIKTYSAINIIYDSASTTGYTVDYTQNDGSLVLTLKANANSTPPSTLSGTLYVDNSMDNAQ